jgi:hypothetical protein
VHLWSAIAEVHGVRIQQNRDLKCSSRAAMCKGGSAERLPVRVKLNSVAFVRERTMPTERPPIIGEIVPTFADKGCRVVSATESYGR